MIGKYLATVLIGTALASGAAVAQTATPAPSGNAASTSMAAPDINGTWRASKLSGLSVYNDQNEKLGSISELLVDSSGKINAVVIGVGGFLGVGQHDIAVRFDSLRWVNEPVPANTASNASPTGAGSSSGMTTGSSTTGANANTSRDKWYPDHAVMSATKDQLKALPEFKYSDYNR